MPGDAEVPRLTRTRRSHDPSCAAVQRDVVRAIKHRNLEMNLRDRQHRQRRAKRMAQAVLVGANSLFAPQTCVDSRSAPEGSISRFSDGRNLATGACSNAAITTRDPTTPYRRTPIYVASKTTPVAKSARSTQRSTLFDLGIAVTVYRTVLVRILPRRN